MMMIKRSLLINRGATVNAQPKPHPASRNGAAGFLGDMNKQQRVEKLVMHVSNLAGLDPVEFLRGKGKMKYEYKPLRDALAYMLDDIGLKRHEAAGLLDMGAQGVYSSCKRQIDRMHTEGSSIIDDMRKLVY